ncbi:hypothetical protein [Nostoc sp. MS1]|uniref:hypothetical protein n=1 Tax=Nostoc sp. MS1 TaxID=2764711 RepID=UPI001CC817CA|nr:hypothetical protein [Nostoc sp. MS1]
MINQTIPNFFALCTELSLAIETHIALLGKSIITCCVEAKLRRQAFFTTSFTYYKRRKREQRDLVRWDQKPAIANNFLQY